MIDASTTLFLAVSSIFGAIATVIARYYQKRRTGWRSTLSILYADFIFEEYATLNLLSLLYAILSGLLSGLAVAFAFLGISSGNTFQLQNNLILSLSCFLLIILIRLSVEGYTVIYKTARDAGRYFILSSRQLISESKGLLDSQEGFINTQEERSSNYNKRQMFRAIKEELEGLEIDSSSVSYGNTSFEEDMVTVRDKNNEVVIVFAKNADGEWNIQSL